MAGEYGVESSNSSPPKIMPDKLKITIKTLPRQLSIAKNMEYTVKSLKDNPENPKKMADNGFIENFENYANTLGIKKLAYTQIPPELIFQDRSVIYSHAMVLLMEMDKNAIDLAPHDETQKMGVVTYDEMGKSTNQLTQYLREHGFAAQASHPAGGMVVYPALAQISGLGHIGRHGMLITPEFGPRQRISAIFTSIQNLPETSENDHSWMKEFCDKCGMCIKSCPGNAITEYTDKSGIRKTAIINDLCHGCTVCMRDCSFNKRDYYQIKTRINNIQAKNLNLN